MRILHVNNINKVAEIYAGELIRRGHSASVYEPNLTGGFAPLPLKLAMMPRRLWDLRHIVSSLNPSHFDILHIHWASYGVLGLVSQIPFVLHCHGNDVRHRLKNPFFRRILTPLLQRAATVMCVTPDILSVVRAVRPDAIFSPGPVDTEQFTPGKNASHLQNNPWTVMLFTRLDPEKGPEIAVKGIELFARRHPNVHVRLLDWGVLKGEYKQRYGDRFEFFPLVPTDEVPYLLQTADVVVGQLTSGALGLSELQAMSCGKPLITFFCYGDAYPTLLPLCQATSPEEVDKHLENLFQHPEVGIKLGLEARAWIINNHSLQVLGGKLENVYRSIGGEQQIEPTYSLSCFNNPTSE